MGLQRKLLLILALLLLPVLLAQAGARPRSGVVEGQIVRTRADVKGLFSIWLRVDGKMHEFMVREARISGGDAAALVPGVPVRIRYRNLEHSEMDDFYTATAVSVTILRKGEK